MTVATETEDNPTFDQIIDQAKEGNRQSLQYSRHRFLWTWLVIALMAILIGFTIWLALRNADTNLEQTDEIARVANTTANQAEQDTDDIVAYMRGEQGIPGVPGSNGQEGTPGQPSSEPGPKGESGAKGDQGDPGTSGPMGSVGPMGSSGGVGPMGAAGSAGSNGEQGAQGENGIQGEQGPKGDKGDTGPRGEQGAAGAAGPVGAAGPQGPSGVTPPLTTTVAVGQSVNDPNTPKTATATCPSGRASGGGYALVPSDPGLIVTASSPVGNTGWNATVEELSLPSDTPWQVIVFVICVSRIFKHLGRHRPRRASV